jgi:hypothetical protein
VDPFRRITEGEILEAEFAEYGPEFGCGADVDVFGPFRPWYPVAGDCPVCGEASCVSECFCAACGRMVDG